MTTPIPPVPMPARLPAAARERLIRLARRQGGVVRRVQLVQVGVTDSQVDRAVGAGRWRALGAGVVVLHNGPLTQQQSWSAAALAGGRPCALAARSAAEAAGLAGWPAEAVEVVVPRGRIYPRLDVRVRVHESRRFTAADVHPTAWPPRVRIERALVDAAVWTPRARTACGLLAAGVQQRLTTAGRLADELARAGRVRHRRILSAALVDIAGGAHAVSEIAFGQFCRRHGLPTPERQRVRTDRNGRRRYLDATLRGPKGVAHVEIDGALHLVVRTYWDDMSRGNELSIAGETHLRFPSIAIHLDDTGTADQIRRALGVSVPSAQLHARAS